MAALMVAWSIVVLGMIFAVLAAPRWCFRRLVRHRIWAMRDELVLAIARDQLPRKNMAVSYFAHNVQGHLEVIADMGVIDLLLFDRAARGTARPDSVNAELNAARNALLPAELELLEEFERRHLRLIAAALIVGSWLGAGLLLFGMVSSSAHGVKDGIDRALRTPLGRRAESQLERTCQSSLV